MAFGVHVTPSGVKDIVRIGEPDPSTTLHDLQKYVGGNIEAVYLNNGGLMYVNEEGLLRGYWPNQWATDYANEHGKFGNSYHILGEVIIIGEEETDEGGVTSAPEELVEVVFKEILADF